MAGASTDSFHDILPEFLMQCGAKTQKEYLHFVKFNIAKPPFSSAVLNRQLKIRLPCNRQCNMAFVITYASKVLYLAVFAFNSSLCACLYLYLPTLTICTCACSNAVIIAVIQMIRCLILLFNRVDQWFIYCVL